MNTPKPKQLPPSVQFLVDEVRDRLEEAKLLCKQQKQEKWKTSLSMLFNWHKAEEIYKQWRVEANQRNYRISRLVKEANELQTQLEKEIEKLD